jgi:glutamine synthetase
MLGSSASVSGPNTFLNTAVAEVLRQFADELENAKNFEPALHDLIRRVIKAHKRIIFNGNGYDDKWLAETEKRGLFNLKTTPDALPYYIKEKSVALFTAHKVYTEKEMHSRYEILMESYCRLVNIEGRTMVDMAMKDILPAVSGYSRSLCDTLLAKRNVCESLDCTYEKTMIFKITELLNSAYQYTSNLEKLLTSATDILDVTAQAIFYKDNVLPCMEELRKAVDGLENIVRAENWPIPTYGELLFGV